MTIPARAAVIARVVLTVCCLAGLAWTFALRPSPVEGQLTGCANGRCDGATLCVYRANESCAFLDYRTCVTYRCKNNDT